MRLPLDWREESIYVAMDGRIVSRICRADGRCYIHKPVPPDSRERWIYENVLGGLPPLYPRMLANPLPKGGSIEEKSQSLWYEDLGRLTHEYDIELAFMLVQAVARWHNASVDMNDRAALNGLKPSYGELADEVIARRDRYAALASKYELPSNKLDELYLAIDRTRPPDELVFSHGDLHVGNYAFANGQLVVMDWEHAHFSSRYWDLFHLIDLTHPLYPREGDIQWRDSLLKAYIEESDKLGIRLDRQAFIAEYHRFAAVFSLWMLGLIESDLAKPDCVWTHAQLRKQAEETADLLHQLLQ